MWICGMYEMEVGSTDRIIQDLKSLCLRSNRLFTAYHARSAAELLAVLESAPGKPIIHLDMHGSVEDGIYLEPSGEHVSWERLHQAFQRINTRMENGLLVVSACCHALRSIKPIHLAEPAPFQVLLAPEKQITRGELEDQTLPFYAELFERGDIKRAQEVGLRSMTYFHSERLLFKSLVDYIAQYCRGEGGEARLERLFAEARPEFDPKVPDDDLRQKLREVLNGQDTSAILGRYENSFLLGQKASFTSEDVEAAVEEQLRDHE